MKARPLYRSMTFWSGILVIAFICWGWWNSMQVFSGFRLPSCWASQAGGGIAMGVHRPRSSHTSTFRLVTKASVEVLSGPYGGMSFALDVKEPVSPLPRPLITSNKGGAVFIPHWLLLLCATVPWAGLLVWRGRRMAKSKLDP